MAEAALPAPPEAVFAASDLEESKRRSETIAKNVFLGMAILLVLPVLAILGYLLVEAWPALSLSFLLQNPRNFMTAGGVWAPLVGTFFLVLISLLAAAPVGVLAGVYLNEYARDNWFTRAIQLGVVNLAGSAKHRARVVRRGGVRAVRPHGPIPAGRFLHAGRDDVAGDHHQHARGPGLGADGLSRGLLEPRRLALADDPHDRAPQRHQRNPHRSDPSSVAGRGPKRPPSCSPGPCSSRRCRITVWRPSSRTGSAIAAWRCRCNLFTLSTQVRGVSEATQYGTAVVLIGLVLAVNSLSIGLRVYLRSRKKW